MEFTPVTDFGGWWAKREDAFGYDGGTSPSGSKVRQYEAMAARQPGAPMIVGCSPHSAMQIYVAAAAAKAGVPGIVYTAKRGKRTAATEYAAALGAEVAEVYPGYPSVYRARARERAKALGACVRWDVTGALRDAVAQCANLPAEVLRVIIPTGSGLTAAGVLAGLAGPKRAGVEVVAVAVSPLATEAGVVTIARKLTAEPLPQFTLVRAAGTYETPVVSMLPDGTPLDPFYAAKAVPFLQDGDCLWVPGLRPVAAFPAACRPAGCAMSKETASLGGGGVDVGNHAGPVPQARRE